MSVIYEPISAGGKLKAFRVYGEINLTRHLRKFQVPRLSLCRAESTVALLIIVLPTFKWVEASD